MDSNIRLRRNRLIFVTITTSHEFLESSIQIVSDSDTDEENSAILTRCRHRLHGTRQKPLRIIGYVNEIIPALTAKQFREHFRMTPGAYELLEEKLGPLLSKRNHSGRSTIPVRKQLLSTLWLLATPDSYRYSPIYK